MARSGTVRVNIVADADGVRRGTRDAERDLDRLNARGRASFHGLGVAAKGSALAIGAAGVVAVKFGADVVKAAAEAEAAQARLKTAVENAGLSYAQFGKQIDEVIQKQANLSAFDDEDLSDSFSKLVVATKDVNEALRLNALVADVARGRQIDLNAANSLVLKSMQGNAGALRRLGLDVKPVHDAQDRLAESTKKVTAEQREQAKEQDKQATRLALIARLQQTYGGQAKAYGDTSAGSLARIGVAWENLQETIGQKAGPTISRVLNGLVQLLNRQGPAWDRVRAAGQAVVDWYRENLEPTVRSVTRAVQAIWDRFGDALTKISKTAFGTILRNIVDALKNLRDLIQGVMALISGDWGTAWQKLSAIPVRIVKGIIRNIKALASQFLTAGKALAKALADGFVNLASAIWSAISGSLGDLGRKIGSAIWNGIKSIPVVGDLLSGFTGGTDPSKTPPLLTGAIGRGGLQPRRAMGGFLPGVYRGQDTMTIRAAPGEVVLNPAQQRIVGIDRIMGALRRTGGVVGGEGMGFATGGWVNPAPGYTPGGGPAAHHSRPLGNWQSDDAWDLMLPNGAPVVAAGDGVIGRISGFNPDPQVWGHGVYLTSHGVTMYYKHLKDVTVASGQHVTAGQIMGHVGVGVNGGPHLHLGVSPVSAGEAIIHGGSVDLVRGIASDKVGGKDGDPKPPANPVARGREIAGGIGKAISGIIGGLGRAGGAAIAGPLAGVRDVPSGLSAAAQTRITAAGTTGAASFARARTAAGLSTSPDQLREAKEDAIREATKREVNKELKATLARKKKVNQLIARISARIKKLAKGMPRKGPQRAAVIRALATLRAQRRKLQNERAGLIAYEVELRSQLQDLDIETLADAAEGNEAAEAAAAETGTEPAGTDTTTAEAPAAADAAGPTPDQAAILAQSEQRAAVAARGLGLAEDFIRTALGPTDISGPGVAPGLIQQNFYSFHPGTPQQLQEVGGATVAALQSLGSVLSSTVPTGV